MSRTYTFSPTAIYGGRTTNRNLYMSTMQSWSDGKRVGCWKQGSTEYYGAVSFFFNFGPVIGKTIQSIVLTPVCSSTFAWSEEVIYYQKSTGSVTDWTIASYAYEATVEKYGAIPPLDVTSFGIPATDAYVIGGYYRTYAYADITGATLTVVTAETTKTVSYNANGGTGEPSATTLWGETEWDGYLSTTVPTRLGYRFDGWNTQANGSGTQYASGAYISVTADTVLYAQWTALSSVLDSVTDANITETTTVSWTNYGTFTNKLRFIFGSVDSGEISVSGTSYQYTLPSSWLVQVPTSTSGTATVYLYTYVNGTLIGTSSSTFTAYVKSSVVPSINNPTATAVNAKWGLYLQKYSSVTIYVTGGAAGTGATVKSYSITGPGINYSTQTTGASASATSDIFSTSGTKTYIVTITDSRGRTASKSVSVFVTEYSEPAISSLVGARCNSDGTLNPTTGTSIKATAVFTFSAVGSNTLTRTLSYKKHSSGSYTTAQTGINSGTSYVIAAGVAEISSSYDVRVEITDSLNNSASYVIVVPPVVGISFGLNNDRARFGGPVEKAGFQVDWDAEFNGVVDVTKRRCYATLSSAGWYRVMDVAVASANASKFSVATIVDINIGTEYWANSNGTHKISLHGVYNNAYFLGEESKSNYMLVSKIRYTYDSSGNGHIDIYYTGTSGNPVWCAFTVLMPYPYQHWFSANNLTAVADSPSGETVLTEYTFAANTEGEISTPVSALSGASVIDSSCYRSGQVISYHIGMQSDTSSAINVSNGTVLATGLVPPAKRFITLGHYYHGNLTPLRCQVTTNGELIVFYSTGTIPSQYNPIVFEINYIAK